MGPTDVPSVGRAPDEIFESLLNEYAIAAALADASSDEVAAGSGALRTAYEMAQEAHAGQTRQTGDSYITHPLIVAEILARFGQDSDTLVAAILHDVVEDTHITLPAIEKEFGKRVAGMIDASRSWTASSSRTRRNNKRRRSERWPSPSPGTRECC